MASPELIEFSYVERVEPEQPKPGHGGRPRLYRSEQRAFAPETLVSELLASDIDVRCPYLFLVAGDHANYDFTRPLTIAIHQSLDEWFECFAEFHDITDQLLCTPIKHADRPELPAEQTESSLEKGERVRVGSIGISLKRTLRVPDAGEIHALPCDAGTLPLVAIPRSGALYDALPPKIRDRCFDSV